MPGVLADLDDPAAVNKLFELLGNANLRNAGQSPQLAVGGAGIDFDELNDPVFGVGGMHGFNVQQYYMDFLKFGKGNLGVQNHLSIWRMVKVAPMIWEASLS